MGDYYNNILPQNIRTEAEAIVILVAFHVIMPKILRVSAYSIDKVLQFAESKLATYVLYGQQVKSPESQPSTAPALDEHPGDVLVADAMITHMDV